LCRVIISAPRGNGRGRFSPHSAAAGRIDRIAAAASDRPAKSTDFIRDIRLCLTRFRIIETINPPVPNRPGQTRGKTLSIPVNELPSDLDEPPVGTDQQPASAAASTVPRSSPHLRPVALEL
jgi:hypothetical protein